MSEDDYKQALHRCAVLMSVDPAPESIYGRELIRIAEWVEQYERAHFSSMSKRGADEQG